MRDPSKQIRDWMYSSLNGNVSYSGATVPVYTFPDATYTMPYIVIGEMSSPGEDGTKDSYIAEYDTTVEIWTSHTGNLASYVPADTIANSILGLLRTEAAMSGYGRDEGGVAINAAFNVIRVNMRGMVTDRMMNDKEVIIYKSININLLVEEV